MFMLVTGYIFPSGHFKESFINILKWQSELLAALVIHLYKLQRSCVLGSLNVCQPRMPRRAPGSSGEVEHLVLLPSMAEMDEKGAEPLEPRTVTNPEQCHLPATAHNRAFKPWPLWRWVIVLG